MPENKKVLLARPHPFIQKAMGEFLAEAGFITSTAASLEEIREAPPGDFCGAVISTSVLSSTKEHYPEVFKALRKHFPVTPILFTTLVGLEQMAPMLGRSLRALEPMSTVVTLEGFPGKRESCGPMAYPLIHKNQLSDPGWKDAAAALVRRYFA